MEPDPQAIAEVALGLAEESFEREYQGGAGVIMPGVFAVDADGRELTRFALLSDPPDAPPSDLVFAQIVSDALAYVLPDSAAAAAWAVVRIEIGWPRIVAWHSSGITCQAWPHFDGEQLSDWHEQWDDGFSDLALSGSINGLIEVKMPNVDGAALALMVRDRLRDERELQSTH